MALPQKVSDQLARVPARTQGVLGQLLMLGTVLFSVSLAVYLGLLFGYRPYLESRINDLDQQIESFTKSVPPADQTELVYFYSQVVNLKSLLQNHSITTPFFDWLEKNTQINVYFSSLSFNAKNGQVTMDASTKSLEDASEQLLVFEKLPEVKEIKINSMSQDASKIWHFNLQLTVDSIAITKPAPAGAGN